MGERVLITGAGGFTGRHLAPLLRGHGHDVVEWLSHRSGPAAPPARDMSHDTVATHQVRARTVRADIRDPDAVRAAVAEARADVVIHLAGAAQPMSPDRLGMLDANVVGADNLLGALARSEAPPRRVIVASSSHVYGEQPPGDLSEAMRPNPLSFYGCSKLSMEQLAQTYAPHFEVLVARPFNYTGRGQAEHFVVPKIVSHFRRRAPVLSMGATDKRRDFSDVRDVCDIYARLVDAPMGGRSDTVNLTTGTVRSLSDVVARCAALSDHRLELRTDPALLRPNDPDVIKASTQRLEDMIGTVPTRPMDDTLRWMLEP